MIELKHIGEPGLLFHYNQRAFDPRDGLTLYGPFNKGKVNNFSLGIIGTNQGIVRMRNWINRFLRPMMPPVKDVAKPFYPGFQAIFGIAPNLTSTVELRVDEQKLKEYYRYSDGFIRVASMVDLYIDQITNFISDDDRPPISLWLVVIPDEVYQYGRIKSRVHGNTINVGFKDNYSKHTEGLFDAIDPEIAKTRDAYRYENHFHHQLKLKLLKKQILTQIVRESTIDYMGAEFLKRNQKPKRDLSKMETDIAWNIACSMYYKIGGLPWKLDNIRPGVCYIGLVFKIDERQINKRYACCAAQMFLDSGDGMVFKGAVGPWYNENSKEYHLSTEAAKDLLTKALTSFQQANQAIPKEIFIHGRAQFDEAEWAGFCEAVENLDTVLIGVVIKDEKTFKLYRDKDFPILRGSYFIKNRNHAYLWTKGFIPRLQQPLGMETPNPLTIKVVQGKGEIPMEIICRDVLALTKLNYNSCKYGDGIPVTLKFANVIGDILTAGPINDLKVALPFKYYI